VTTPLDVDTAEIIASTEVSQPYAPMFEIVTAEGNASQADLRQLANGTAGALCIRGMLTDAQCATVMRNIDEYAFDNYDERRIYPAVAKFGPGAFDYYLDGNMRPDYWEHAEQARQTWARVFGDRDPVRAVVDKLAEAVQAPAGPATIGGRPLYVGVLRDFSGGAIMHFDEIVREFPGVFDEEPIVQFGFNCHLSKPEAGGELTVWRRRWRPGDDTSRIGYGWDTDIATEEPSVTIRAEVGDAVLFDSRNYHTVAPSQGRRITLSCFIGITISGRMLLWS
jgi:hypothetical protein